MSGRPWYKRYGADFVHGCLGLTLEEKGAYSLCLDLIYDRGGPIPDDARWLAGVCGVSLRKWTSLRARLIEAGKLVEQDGRLSNTRAEKEIEAAAKTAQKLAESGSKGGEKRAENARSSNNNNELEQASLKHTRINQKPETRNQISDADASDARAQPQVVSDPEVQPPNGGMTSAAGMRSDGLSFARFWQVYPHKVGKQDAEKAFNSVMKRGAVTLERMLAALDGYMRTKPPDRPWCNPATWLRQGRWDDEPGPDPIQRGPFPPPPPSPSRSSVGLSAVADWVLESTGGGPAPQAGGGFRPDGGAEGYGSGDVLPLGPAPRPRFAG